MRPMELDRLQLKHQRRLFKQWKEKPFDYKIEHPEPQHCNNCGNDFVGNFCPYCSQRAGVGRVTWRSVHQGVMDIWGLGTRSLLYTLLQLLLRPGQLIGEYISGKRQVSFPPVKMLFIVALIYSAVVYWFFPSVLGIDIEKPAEGPLNAFDEWARSHYSWSSLLMSIFAIVPTWVMFRNSPRNTRHLLPEGFFIQIFLSVLFILTNFLVIPISLIQYQVGLFINMLFLMVYYIIVYKKLFGYSLWGTLWRQGFVLMTVVFLTGVFVFMIVDIDIDLSIFEVFKRKQLVFSPMVKRMLVSCVILAFAVMTLIFGWLCNLIATRWTRRRAHKI